eukprot:3309150-Pleurochrysis_carterae.AAC.1
MRCTVALFCRGQIASSLQESSSAQLAASRRTPSRTPPRCAAYALRCRPRGRRFMWMAVVWSKIYVDGGLTHRRYFWMMRIATEDV